MNRAAVAYIEGPEGKLLCVWNLRYRGWSLPGGKVEEGETVEAACRRELEEETGMFAGALEQIYEGEHGIKVSGSRGSYVHIFRVEAFGEPRAIEEGCPVTWLTRAEFLGSSPFAPFYEKVFAAVPLAVSDWIVEESAVMPPAAFELKLDTVAHAPTIKLPAGAKVELRIGGEPQLAGGRPSADAPCDHCDGPVGHNPVTVFHHDRSELAFCSSECLHCCGSRCVHARQRIADLNAGLLAAFEEVSALRAEKRAMLAWLDATAASWENKFSRSLNVGIAAGWRSAHDGLRDGDHRGGLLPSQIAVLERIDARVMLGCDHCGGDALESDDGTFEDGAPGPCMTCGFPGHVSVDGTYEDPDENTASFALSEEPNARCRDPGCGECCDECKSATGGACVKHAEPEPVER